MPELGGGRVDSGTGKVGFKNVSTPASSANPKTPTESNKPVVIEPQLPGPAGVAGATGPQGPTGATGPAGPPGTNASQSLNIVTFGAATLTLNQQLANVFAYFRITAATSVEFADSLDVIPVGSWFTIKNTQASIVTLTPGGATINVGPTFTTSIIAGGVITVVKVGTNAWDVAGGLSAA